MVTLPDDELVRRMRDGDAAAFDELYRRYRGWAGTLALRFTGHREDALDVLQETFAYLHRRRRDLELRNAMKTFLYPVVKHLALDRKKASRRQMPLDPKLDPAAPAVRTDEARLRHAGVGRPADGDPALEDSGA